MSGLVMEQADFIILMVGPNVFISLQELSDVACGKSLI